MRRLAPALAATALLFGAAAASAHGPKVTIGHNRIEPAEVTIRAGGVVHFHSVDSMPGGHTLVAADGSFESPPLAVDQDWHHTFEKPGEYRYHIAEHPDAKGVIVVEEAGEDPSSE